MTGHDLSAMRTPYDRPPLRRRDLHARWDEQLAAWLAEAERSGLPEPNAMVLATADADARPSTRTVLLKAFDADGITFFTNYRSAKGRDLSANPHCSVTFPWIAIARQVTLLGTARRIGDTPSDEYFASRPRGSQIGAAASPQSEVVPGREALERRVAEVLARHPEGTAVPRPHDWGGYLLQPRSVEFWQGRPDRLHDRLRYARTADGAWIVERLAP